MDTTSPDEFDEQVDSDVDSFVDDNDEHDVKLEGSPQLSGPAAGASSGKSGAHTQKRRRVTRACDECRRKKIKCDGKQPCTHCTVYSYDCTYDQPSNRRRNPAPQYVENLEHRVHRAETLLHILIPNLDMNDPGIDAAVAQGWIPGAPGKGAPMAVQNRQQPAQRPSQRPPQPSAPPPNNESKMDSDIESMLRAVAQLDMDEGGDWGYHGHSSGLSFVRRMREQLGDLMGPETVSTPFVKSRPLSETLESPRSAAESPVNSSAGSSPSGQGLPAKALARETCTSATETAAPLLRVVHKPSFWASFERLYDLPHEQYTNEDHKFLPLFYSAMALGSLFNRRETETKAKGATYEDAIQQGIVYFRTARSLMDVTDCRGLTSIQAVLFMMLFLQSSAKLSQCYAYVGVALRASLRMGLHRSHGDRFNPLESEIRKRVFWVVRKMDIYIGAMLGLPLTLSDDDVDQEFPAEIDDEYITKDGIRPMPQDQVSLLTAFNAHTRLVQILAKIVRYIYPIKSNPDKSYSVPFSAIREIEGDLERWKQSLPPIFNPCPAPERYVRVQQFLRVTYAHAQVMLYRPFLHFVAMDKRSKPIDQRSYACAASYVNVSRNIIHIQSQMNQKGLLNGAGWFTQYTSFFAILSLVYFAAENPDNATTEAVMKDALEGRDVLRALSRYSMAADRCTATLDGVFQRLPAWMRNGQSNPSMTRKRNVTEVEASKHAQSQPQSQPSNAARSQANFTSGRSGDSFPMTSRRAPTLPMKGRSIPTSDGLAEGWSQSGSSTRGPQTPNGGDMSTFMAYSQPSPSYPLQQYQLAGGDGGGAAYSNSALADISGMFPAADDPFGYPTQPLTTYESQQQFGKDPSLMLAGAPNATAPFDSLSSLPTGNGAPFVPSGSQNNREDGLEAQFFALPPYLDRQAPQVATGFAGSGGYLPDAFGSGLSTPTGQMTPNGTGWTTSGGHLHPAVSAAAAAALQTNSSLDMMDAQQQQQQQINIQGLFGGNEWGPTLMTGFQTQ